MFENKLPLLEFDIFNADPNQASKITIKIESRKARISDNPKNDPKDENCWRYIRIGSKEDKKTEKPLETFIGPIINVRRDVELKVHWKNKLVSMNNKPGMDGACQPEMPAGDPMLEMPPINQPPMDKNPQMADMNPSVGVVAHLHGGKIHPASDGWPVEPLSFPGNPYHVTGKPAKKFPTEATYTYPNQQRASMLWFHDHGMDNTAPQVHAGLAGLYFIRDQSDDDLFSLLGGQIHNNELMELPLVIQDRVVDCDFCCFDYWAGLPTKNTLDTVSGKLTSIDSVRPEFLGDSIFVNGRPWPHHEVGQNRYRLRIVNGSNARTYALALVNPEPWTSQNVTGTPKVWYSDKITVIGNDGGLFPLKQTLQETDYIVLAPGERLDLILDLTDICPDEVSKLRMVNLAVGSLFNGDWPEGIFQFEATGGSILQPTPIQATPNPDYKFLTTLLAIKQANIMQFCIKHNHGECDCSTNQSQITQAKTKFLDDLDQLLLKYADDEGFHWDDASKTLVAINGDAVQNRLIVLMNDTKGLKDAIGVINTFTEEQKWHDTQIWEMGAVKPDSTLTPFQIPFDVTVNQVSQGIDKGQPSSFKDYQVLRSTFFKPNPGLPDKVITNNNQEYPELAQAQIKPQVKTYERWYVANIGNWQPADGVQTIQIPDMHPFHIHLVNFVVLRRFVLQTNGSFVQSYPSIGIVNSGLNTFDGQVRHDTVRINSNELVELLVYFPEGYTGQYPYHCHLVEHEDMGMMSHFEVQASN
ncbi:multicopper oxidase domain-containing protein [Methylomonas sp. AM2-LC]|uniref:multicopper oxidase family protein n=1 Tax=Methylomonas sp. AM2-LC TaxID=3153301 RepID=UPI003263E9D2